MTPHSNAEQEEVEFPIDLPTTDSESNAEGKEKEDAVSDNEVDEEEMKKWLSTTYVRGSRNPMKKPLTEPWGLPTSDSDVEKLKFGVKSRDMDDKWDILVEDPDENGNLSIHILRCWLQEECYIFHIVPKSSNGNGGSAVIQSFTWEGNKGGFQCDVEQAKKEAVMLSRGHLDCEFETLPQYPSSDFWDSNAYKTLDEE